MMGEVGADREKRGGTSCIKKGKWATSCRCSCIFNQSFPCCHLHMVYLASMNWEDWGGELQLAHGYYMRQSECWAALSAQGAWWHRVDCTHQGHGAGTPCFGCDAELRKGQFGVCTSSVLGESWVIEKREVRCLYSSAGTLTVWIMPFTPLRAFVSLWIDLERIFSNSWV